MKHKEMIEVLKEKLETAKKYVSAGDDYFSREVQALSLAIEKLQEDEKLTSEVISTCNSLLEKIDAFRRLNDTITTEPTKD